MIIVSTHEAKTNLSRLLDQVQEGGEEVIISRGKKPLAKLVPYGRGNRRLGYLKDKMEIAEDFDAPLPDEILDTFEGTE